MIGQESQQKKIEEKLDSWRQGDVSLDSGLQFMHFADLSCPHSPASLALVKGRENENRLSGIVPIVENVVGIVVLTQTCDILRSYRERPYVEIAPLVLLDEAVVEQVRRLKRPAYAYVPATAKDRLVADLDRVMVVEKAVLANWTRTPGWTTDTECRSFASALSRKRSRFAFPNDFARTSDRFRNHMIDKHKRNSSEGSHLRSLREIRVCARPYWDHDNVKLNIWFIKDDDPLDFTPEWSKFVEKWRGLFDESDRFQIESAIACRLDDITASDYVESDVLDLDSVSVV